MITYIYWQVGSLKCCKHLKVRNEPNQCETSRKDDNYFKLQQALHFKSNLDESCILISL